MRKLLGVMLAVVVCGTTFATNTFTGAVNNQPQNAANWSGTLQDWDDAVVADWAVVRVSGTTWSNMKYNTVTFNNQLNGVSATPFVWNTAPSVTNYYRDRVVVDADVTKNVRLGGVIAYDDSDLLFLNNSPTAQFEAYGGFVSGNLDVTYAGASGAKFKLGGGAVNSKYIGTTTLDGVRAEVIVSGAANNGPFGVASNQVQMLNDATLAYSGVIQIHNDIAVEPGHTATIQDGTRYLNGKISGSGTLNHSGGTVIFNNTDMDSDFSGEMTFATVVSQARGSDQFGTAALVLKTGANFRGFNDQVGETINILNEIEVGSTAPSDLVRIASAGIANGSPHTVVSNITFTAAGNLVLQATASSASTSDSTTVDVTGVISDGSNTGNVVIDNEWGGISYTNGVVNFYAAQTYTGTTTLEDGRLQLIGDASIDDSSEIIFLSDGILDLTARAGGSYIYGGIVSGSGTVQGDLTLTNTLKLTMAGTGAGDYDVLAGNGSLVLGNTIQFEDEGLYTNDVGAAFTVLPGWTSVSGTPELVSASGVCEWDFDSSTGMATLLSAPEPPAPPPLITDTVWTFNTPGDTEGWYDSNEQSIGMTTTNGVLTVDATTGEDPFLQLDARCSPDSESWYTAEMRVRQLGLDGNPVTWDSVGCSTVVDHLLGDEGWTLLGTIDGTAWGIEAEAEGEWITATRSLTDLGTNILTGIRFDAIGGAGSAGKAYEVDYIKLTRGTVETIKTVVDAWEFNTDGDVEGWTVVSETAVVGHTATNGVMTCSATTGDPQWLYTAGVSKPSQGWSTLEFRARQLDGGSPVAWSGGGTVSVITGVANITPFLGSTARVIQTDEADSWAVFEMDISECTVETISNIRLDFLPAPRTIEVDWIRFCSKEEGLTGYNNWAYRFDDLDDIASAADPDGDGSDNFSEYAFGGDPSDPASGPIGPSLRVVDGMLEYVYGKRTDDDALTYSLQGCQALVDSWSNLVNDVDYIELGSGAVTDEMDAVTNQIPMDVDMKFIRTIVE